MKNLPTIKSQLNVISVHGHLADKAPNQVHKKTSSKCYWSVNLLQDEADTMDNSSTSKINTEFDGTSSVVTSPNPSDAGITKRN